MPLLSHVRNANKHFDGAGEQANGRPGHYSKYTQPAHTHTIYNIDMTRVIVLVVWMLVENVHPKLFG